MEKFFNGKKFEETLPRPSGVDKIKDADKLLVKRYGTDDTIRIAGAEQNIEYILKTQAASIEVLYHKGVIPKEERDVLLKTANLNYVKPDRVRQIEEQTDHDIIAVNTAWEEQVRKLNEKAASHIHKFRASADATESQWALQAKDFLENYSFSLENLRDIIIEKAVSEEWFNTPHVIKTHGFDAAPSVAGRPLIFYAESIQQGIDLLEYFYKNSTVGKWGDAIGCHHSAKSGGLDGIETQEEYCRRLGIGHMIAPAQIVSREFHTDIVYGIARTQGTIANLSQYLLDERDQDCLTMKVPRKRKGSSSLPLKDAMGGNPIKEEQAKSSFKRALGDLMTSAASIEFKYGRDLTNSASNRVLFEELYKMSDHTARRMTGAVYELILIPERCIERFDRTYGTTTSENVMNYLIDPRKTDKPLGRKEAHQLASDLAKEAYDKKIQYKDLCLGDERIKSRFDEKTIVEMTDPFKFIGESQKQIEMIFDEYHGKKSVPSQNYLNRIK